MFTLDLINFFAGLGALISLGIAVMQYKRNKLRSKRRKRKWKRHIAPAITVVCIIILIANNWRLFFPLEG